MGWLILGTVIGFGIGSFFPQPELFKGWYDSLQEKYQEFKDKE